MQKSNMLRMSKASGNRTAVHPDDWIFSGEKAKIVFSSMKAISKTPGKAFQLGS